MKEKDSQVFLLMSMKLLQVFIMTWIGSAGFAGRHIFLVVDAISSFLADEFDMEALGVQVMITGSQKALACAPGISVIVMSDEAVKRAFSCNAKCLYLNLRLALENGERGQTPFTPAVGILRQINVRLKEIQEHGGAESEIRRVSDIAGDFRNKILRSAI